MSANWVTHFQPILLCLRLVVVVVAVVVVRQCFCTFFLLGNFLFFLVALGFSTATDRESGFLIFFYLKKNLISFFSAAAGGWCAHTVVKRQKKIRFKKISKKSQDKLD